MKDMFKPVFAIGAIAASLLIFVTVLDSNLPAIVKFVLGAASLAGCGMAIAGLYKLEHWAGMFLLRSQHGLKFLDSVARKYPRLWQYFAEMGMIVGYGSLAYFIMGRKKMGWKVAAARYAPGTFILIFVYALLPVAMAILLSMVRGGEEFSTAGSKFQEAASGVDGLKYISAAMLAFGGITFLTTISIVTYAGIVGAALISALMGNGGPIAATPPGGMPILPGVNLDLVQGLLALAVVLLVHEGMHGVLARLYKLPLKSAGLVIFGFLPFGAFVDIDEKRLFKERKERQNSVMVAGTAANFATAIFFLALLISFVALVGASPSDLQRQVGRFIALTFSLNVIVAAVNLVPLPMFDGYHIMRNAVPHPWLQKAIVYLVGLSFLLTLFPWVLR